MFGATALPVYSLSVAHINDRLKPEQLTSASSTMVLFSGLGATAGPITVGYLLHAFGNEWFLLYLGAINLVLGLTVLYYMTQRKAVPEEQQMDHQFMTSRMTPVAMEALALDAEEAYLADEESVDEDNSEDHK